MSKSLLILLITFKVWSKQVKNIRDFKMSTHTASKTNHPLIRAKRLDFFFPLSYFYLKVIKDITFVYEQQK